MAFCALDFCGLLEFVFVSCFGGERFGCGFVTGCI